MTRAIPPTSSHVKVILGDVRQQRTVTAGAG